MITSLETHSLSTFTFIVYCSDFVYLYFSCLMLRFAIVPQLFDALINVSPTDWKFSSVHHAGDWPVIAHSHLVFRKCVVVAVDQAFLKS